jgi:hypothetical protein
MWEVAVRGANCPEELNAANTHLIMATRCANLAVLMLSSIFNFSALNVAIITVCHDGGVGLKRQER